MLSEKEAKKLVKKNITKCYKGAFVWHNLLKENPEISNTVVILLPEIDDICNYYALLYIEDFLNSTHRDNAVILTVDNRIQQVYSKFSSRIIKIVPLTPKNVEYLMQYLSLYCFDDRLVVASLDKPEGRNGSALVGLKDLSVEEVFVIGVYRLYPFKKRAPLTWTKSGTELDQFMDKK